jgi:hypothetical protein
LFSSRGQGLTLTRDAISVLQQRFSVFGPQFSFQCSAQRVSLQSRAPTPRIAAQIGAAPGLLAGRVNLDRMVSRAYQADKLALRSLSTAGSARPLRNMPLRHTAS